MNFLFLKDKVRLILSFCHLLVFEKGKVFVHVPQKAGQVSEGKVRPVHQHNEFSEILSDEFLLEVERTKHQDLAFELLKKLLNDEIKTSRKTNLVKSRT